MNHLLNNSTLKRIRIIFFIGSLRTGGKERRMIELLSYLKAQGDKYDLLLVINYDYINYPAFEKLGIPVKVLDKRPNHKDPRLFFQFYKICLEFKPDIIHAWGGMQAFYSIPASVKKRIPLINSQITSAPPKIKKLTFLNLINQINFIFSDVILSNSKAGLEAYNPPGKKSHVIHNGINPERFVGLPLAEDVRKKYDINAQYAVVMVAHFSENKDFDLFYRIARYTTKLRPDITFIGVGGPAEDGPTRDGVEFQRLTELAQGNLNIIFPGRINDVEALVNACDIGMLLSNKTVHGEGIPNTVLEYMALGKAVIANDAGGTKELVRHNENGYLVTGESVEEISEMILELIENAGKRLAFGNKGKEIVNESFTIDKMGKAFEDIYHSATT
jgi:glycosyltransferase involved in cell wall biosynthesis